MDWKIFKKRLSSLNDILLFLLAHGILSFIYTLILMSTISDFSNKENLSWGIYGLYLLSLLFTLLMIASLVLSGAINIIRRFICKS